MSKKNFFLVLAVFFALLILNGTLLVKYAKAQVPGFRYPGCNNTSNPEFNSGRPYQSAACGDSVKALFCGNEIQIKETIKKTVDGHVDSIDPNINVVDKPYEIDLSDTEFPILGNTEDVKNSQNSTDTIDDATKLSEYAAWYLTGVNNRAEYGETKNTPNELVNFSGPIQKLLPSALLDYQRINTIAQASNNKSYLDEESAVGSETPTQTVTEPESHNQIVACASKQIFGINNSFVGKTVAHECYSGNDSDANGEYRLKDWDVGALSLFNTVLNFLGTDKWNKKYPPLPWQFKEEVLYQKAYYEWKGKTCAIIPITNTLTCFDNPLVSNEWADLFQYVPLANTSDKNAKMPIYTITIQPSAGTSIASKQWTVVEEPTHFYPHTLEVKDLSTFLNSTYIPKDAEGGIPTETTENNSKCSVVNVRSNAGDELFPEKKPADVRIKASYEVDEIPCKHGFYKDGRPKSDCEGEVYIGIQTNPVKVPYANEIWKSTVADSTSTFRRIFPKVEEGAPVSCVADIPSVTGAVYTPVTGTSELKIKGPLGSPDEHSMDPETAKIYFPHFGSVYEYFLKGIQTALRPQGYGEPITDGTNCSNLKCGELPKNLPKGSGSCGVGSISSKVGDIPQSLKDIIGAASETYKVPANLILGVMYGEGAFNTEPFRRYQWTDQNVNNWATCQPIANCSSPETSVVPFFSVYWDKLAKEIAPDLKKLDPNRADPDPCNLLDVTYAVAKDLSTNQFGSDQFAGKSCFGIPLNTPSSAKSSGDCNWSSSNIETAIRVWEFGTNYDLPVSCATKPGGCATGGGFDAGCPNGDNCEKFSNAGNTSHNACVWDVAHGH